MNLILFDDPAVRPHLQPFASTRPVAKIRIGILTIAEKWEKRLGLTTSFSTANHLAGKFPATITDDNLWINGAVCPTPNLVDIIKNLQLGEGLHYENRLIALRTSEDEIPEVVGTEMRELTDELVVIDRLWKIVAHNGRQLRLDFSLITSGRKSVPITDEHTIQYNKENIFCEDGVYIRAATLNAEDGPIYLGKNSIVQEGAIIKGPFALGESGHINMGGKMRGDVSIGPFSKVGGEVSNVVIFGYSNKAHDGFLGGSVIGEWCNLGADTNNSNMKNNYDDVKMWSYATKSRVDTGLQFLGLMMGDHSKSGINTMFNTGTVVGVSANVFGGGFPDHFIPSFSWGGPEKFSTYELNKALSTAAKVMERRKVMMDEEDKKILTEIFEEEISFRNWDKVKE